MKRSGRAVATTALLNASLLAAAPKVGAHDPVQPTALVAPEGVACSIESDADTAGLRLHLEGFTLDLTAVLAPKSVSKPGASAVRITGDGTAAAAWSSGTYRGAIEGIADSDLALTVGSGWMEGLLRAGRTYFTIEGATGGDCAATLQPLDASSFDLGAAAGFARGNTLSGDTPFVLEYGVVGDYEWFTRWGADSTSRMQSVVNAADVIFIDQLNITLQISHSQVFETAEDPFSDFDSSNLFANFRDATTEFGEWREDEGGPVADAGLAHLFSDKALGLTSGGAGFGFIDELCDVDRGVSLSTTKFFNSIPFSGLILAHELGHNFGSPHDGEGACSSAPGGFIMASAATGSQFSDCSKDIMIPRAESASCILEGASAAACAQPATTGSAPTATDCLFILNAAVGLQTCSPECICAPGGSLPATASDALVCLTAAVGGDVTLDCPCT